MPDGRFAALVGPSGGGKSTLLSVLAGLLVPTGGTARIDGEDVVGRPGAAAWLPQGAAALPWRRVLANAALGAELAGVPRDEARRRARAELDRFGLAGRERAWPAQLSGGMRQRLALLRTFLVPRSTLLLDEPFAALDALTRAELHAFLQSVWLGSARTALLVTHDLDEALLLADEVHVLSARPGRIVRTLSVPLPRPRDAAALAGSEAAELRAALLRALSTPPP